jgi:thiamine-phosphate pyrophosphorylase
MLKRTGPGVMRLVTNKLKSLDQCSLYTFVDTAYLRGRDPAAVARQLCNGGADLIQLRAKQSGPDEIRQMTEDLLPVTNAAGVWLVVNDYPQIAIDTGAPLCHLGQEDFFDAGHHTVGELVPETASPGIGMSTHSPAQAERALAAGAVYLAVGPVYSTDTKPTAVPVTLDYVRWAAAHLSVPWFAIGGINLDNLDAVLSAGAQRICVVSAILNAPDVTAVCREFRRCLDSRAGPASRRPR